MEVFPTHHRDPVSKVSYPLYNNKTGTISTLYWYRMSPEGAPAPLQVTYGTEWGWCGEAIWTIDLRPWTLDRGLGSGDDQPKSEKGVLQKGTKTAEAESGNLRPESGEFLQKVTKTAKAEA